MSSIRKYDLEIIISLISDIVNTARGLRRTQGNLIVAKSARPPPLHPGRRNDRANPKLVGETQGAADRWDKWAATHHCPPSTHCLTVCRHLGNQKWWASRSCVFLARPQNLQHELTHSPQVPPKGDFLLTENNEVARTLHTLRHKRISQSEKHSSPSSLLSTI